MAQRHYLECSPRRRPFEEPTGKRYTGQIPTPEALEQPGVRRRHITEYIAFIRPEISHIITEYGRAAIKRVCQELYATGVRATPSPWFGLMCERIMWKMCFDPLGDDAPEWPWAHVKYPSVLAQGEEPNGIYARYCQERRVQDEGTARMNAQLKAQADAAAAARAADPNNKYTVTSPAPLQNIGEPLRVDPDLDIRRALWNLTISKPFNECNAVGPFEVEPKVPLEYYVFKDLAAINGLLPACIAVKLNITNKRVFVTIVESAQVNPAIPVREILLDVWEAVQSWAGAWWALVERESSFANAAHFLRPHLSPLPGESFSPPATHPQSDPPEANHQFQYHYTNSADMGSIQKWITLKAQGSKYRRDIAFAHVKIDLRYGSDQHVWGTVLGAACGQSHARVWVVGPDTQTDIATLAWDQVNSLKTLKEHAYTDTFQEFSKFLHSTRKMEGQKAKAWKFDRDRPQTVLLYVDPLMSAECALAMVETVHWATDISHATPVRVITVSNAALPDSLKRLIHHYGHRNIKRFIFSGPEETLDFLERDLKDEDEKQVVVCYSPWEWTRDLPVENKVSIRRMAEDNSLNDRLKGLETIPSRDIRTYEPKQVDKNKYVVTSKEDRIILQIPPGYRQPSRLDSFEQVHLCLSPFREQVIFDPHTERLARMRLLTSQEERREQVSLAYRTGNVPFRVAMYCDEGTVDNFVESGSPERRLKVCNEHAPGFLLSLVILMDWEIDILKIISCFFPTEQQKSIVDKIQYGFLYQHVARYVAEDSDDEDAYTAEEDSIFNSLGDLIEDRESIVRQLLPILDFDYRLAVFLARPTQSCKVFKAKLQLAAILTVGIDKLFNFPHRGTMSHEEYRDSLIEACHGWTSPLAHTGSMWLAVGLWKHGATIVGDHNMADLNEVKIPGTSVTMNLDAFNSVQRVLTALSNTFISSFISVLPDFLAETVEMDDSECEEIQQHLVWAYIHQIVETRKLPDGKIVHQLGASSREFRGDFCITLPPWAFDDTDYDNLLEEDGSCDENIECIMGVFHGMSREFGMSNVYLDDWTYIPEPALRNVCLEMEYSDLPTCEPNLPRDDEEEQALSGGFE
ncbi:uncharacterized protein FTJAE_4246 [Fusarium tjaetaba]|uniref:Uncharacterized protein n=1 Tax=Fusarium tjaetaba TaxID=1567544 RepID=A0A8H5RW71_9HYPO|nr:uncharacterized protein FTJAE_4246 [Fusarium tjaetaba]KAF5641064.1 hypothetical protein FTJAE_4246 [Fusarium tjaetaba]